MKKKLAILLSLAMVLTFALAACGGGGSGDVADSKYVGTWKADSASFIGESGDLDHEFVLTLNSDGTGTISGVDDEGVEDVSNITWSLIDGGFKTKGDAKMKFQDDGDGIMAKILGVELHFVRAEEGGTAAAVVDGSPYGYGGDDPAEAACYKYMATEVSKDYEPADESIPTVAVVYEDSTPEDEILVYGDFWVDNYNLEGDVLKTASGGNYPGCMHVSKADYTVTAFDVVQDGENWDSSAKEIFGDHYDDFMKIHNDTDARNELRKVTVTDYVFLNALDAKYYQDEGWDPVELYPQPEE